MYDIETGLTQGRSEKPSCVNLFITSWKAVYLPFRLGVVFSWFMATLIVLNVIALILETEASVYAGWRFWFNLFEAASVTLFTLDYIARMWACVEQPEYAGPGPVKRPVALCRDTVGGV